MTFGQRLRQRREEIGLTRAELAKRLNVTLSAISNYETGVSFPKADIFMRIFNCLDTDPNTLLQDSFQRDRMVLNAPEQKMMEQYRTLPDDAQEVVSSLIRSLLAMQKEAEEGRNEPVSRQIPLYRCPAAAGYTAPVFGEDFEYIPVDSKVPPGAEYAVRIQGDSMVPWIMDGSVVYVNRDPLAPGDVGIFCVDGEMYCKQYGRDGAGTVYLFSLNRDRADADITLLPTGGRMLVCLGRVILRHAPPLPEGMVQNWW